MSLIECLIERADGGHTEVRLSGFRYLFRPLPGRGKYEKPYVCEVSNEGHKRHLINSGNFRLYRPEEQKADPALVERQENSARIAAELGEGEISVGEQDLILTKDGSPYPHEKVAKMVAGRMSKTHGDRYEVVTYRGGFAIRKVEP